MAAATSSYDGPTSCVLMAATAGSSSGAGSSAAQDGSLAGSSSTVTRAGT